MVGVGGEPRPRAARAWQLTCSGAAAAPASHRSPSHSWNASTSTPAIGTCRAGASQPAGGRASGQQPAARWESWGHHGSARPAPHAPAPGPAPRRPCSAGRQPRAASRPTLRAARAAGGPSGGTSAGRRCEARGGACGGASAAALAMPGSSSVRQCAAGAVRLAGSLGESGKGHHAGQHGQVLQVVYPAQQRGTLGNVQPP